MIVAFNFGATVSEFLADESDDNDSGNEHKGWIPFEKRFLFEPDGED